MKVDIKHEVLEKGLIKKTKWYGVGITVNLTEEEREVADESKLLYQDVVELPKDPFLKTAFDHGNMSVYCMSDSDSVKKERNKRFFKSKADAIQVEKIALEALKDFKAAIVSESEEAEDKSVEF